MTKEKTDDSNMLSTTDLAFERTLLAENRTLMAWIRTAISLISFGFTIYKFFEETLKEAKTVHHILTPRIAGMTLIIFGLLSLLWGLTEYNMGFKKLKKYYPAAEKSRSSMLGLLVLLLGLALFLAALFRQ